MSSTQYTMERHANTALSEVAEELKAVFDRDIVKPEIVISQIDQVGDGEVLLIAFEKFYMRNGSMATVTVQCISSGGVQKATVIGTGGGEGIFNISLGANSDFAYKAAVALKGMGFEQIDSRKTWG